MELLTAACWAEALGRLSAVKRGLTIRANNAGTVVCWTGTSVDMHVERYVGPEADAARREARATSEGPNSRRADTAC